MRSYSLAGANRVKKLAVPSLLFIVACSNSHTSTSPSTNSVVYPETIYGTDNRKDFYETTNPDYKKWADSTVTLVGREELFQSDGKVSFRYNTHEDANGVCHSERFSQQQVLGYCSGSLVAPNVILTAGHCIHISECGSTLFLFDYAMKSATDNLNNISVQEVYRCRRIIHREFKSAGTSDFALVELDRAVTNHAVLPIGRKANTKIHDPVVIAGYPFGLPVKIADGAWVRQMGDQVGVSTVDASSGDSGAPIFNIRTGELIGVEIAGDRDTKMDRTCRTETRCSDTDCSGEFFFWAENALPYLPSETKTQN
jgi:V8-like Glu-specific endopeptidase